MFSHSSGPDDALTGALDDISVCDDRLVAARALREHLRAAGYEIVRITPINGVPQPDPPPDFPFQHRCPDCHWKHVRNPHQP